MRKQLNHSIIHGGAQSLKSSRCCQWFGTEVWAGNVNKPLFLIKHLWIYRLFTTSFADRFSVKSCLNKTKEFISPGAHASVTGAWAPLKFSPFECLSTSSFSNVFKFCGRSSKHYSVRQLNCKRNEVFHT